MHMVESETKTRSIYKRIEMTQSDMGSSASYKDAIKTFMDKKLQRDMTSISSSASSISRVFRERQSRRMFEELQ